MASRLVRNPQEVAIRRLARAVGRSPSVLLGRVPAERREHYDADDQLTGYTIVIREPEWTDDDRRQMRELEVYEAGLHKCGYHVDLLKDKTNIFMPEEWKCPVCAGMAERGRMLSQRDKQAQRGREVDALTQPGDGRETRWRLLSSTEAETVREKLSALERARSDSVAADGEGVDGSSPLVERVE